jgi:hypothetical protein
MKFFIKRLPNRLKQKMLRLLSVSVSGENDISTVNINIELGASDIKKST